MRVVGDGGLSNRSLEFRPLNAIILIENTGIENPLPAEGASKTGPTGHGVNRDSRISGLQSTRIIIIVQRNNSSDDDGGHDRGYITSSNCPSSSSVSSAKQRCRQMCSRTKKNGKTRTRLPTSLDSIRISSKRTNTLTQFSACPRQPSLVAF